jgi:dihydroxyacetone kinase-like protein
MKKFINEVDDFILESLSGLAQAHPNLVSVNLDPMYVIRKDIANKKVVLISGGGSGHEPLHSGFVGHGMLDIACPGHVFTSPTPDQMIAALEAYQPEKGVLFIVKNYSGDVMNFEMAAEMTSYENKSLIINDDAAVINSSHTTGKRGVAGTVIIEKVLGNLAETGGNLDQCLSLGQRVNNALSTMGIALTSCTVPAAGKPTFDIGDDEVEVGVGIHGEPGRRREKIKKANLMVDDMIDAILADLKEKNVQTNNSEVLLLVNGYAGTPLSELYLLFDVAAKNLKARDIKIARSLVGNYTTALDMAGASLTLCVLDDEIKNHWDAPVLTPALRWGM